MKTNFIPKLFYDPNPTPWGAIAGGVIGGIQSIFGAIKERRAEKKAEKLINGYQPNQSIMDYYSKALQKYNVNPYTSPLYNHTAQKVGASTAQGINAFQDRRSANAGISSLIQNQNDTLLKAAATAEDQSGQALGRLGQATQLKAGEDKYKFENLLNLQLQKAGGGAKVMNAGLSNIFGSINNVSQMDLLNKYYGDNSSSGGNGSGGGYDPTSSPYWKRRTGG